MKFPWQTDKNLSEELRKQRGKLAQEIVRNDRVRSQLEARVKEGSVGQMLDDIFKRLDEAKGG